MENERVDVYYNERHTPLPACPLWHPHETNPYAGLTRRLLLSHLQPLRLFFTFVVPELTDYGTTAKRNTSASVLVDVDVVFFEREGRS